MLVGEQPGDREDVEGEPFVGPAGGMLARALQSAEIDRSDVYLTNAVKHFKWRPRGKRRLHQTPRAGEVEACKPWLDGGEAALAPPLFKDRSAGVLDVPVPNEERL
ncbi:MAG TPA: uracil-DNA glycosylase family protein [Solirubrobacterales bacterium]|nr:uracil-DNA glycosylase family protein [Solirubrobacterales bacterium]